ncbi:Metal-dependent hydrolase YbeY, involved in rRNA and/or ribosome maturation and assembly [invertebrate metagenome]|uniref:Metal-dependent hydrolase YbeY, involved in rRNA and/or ribosome maturation and assembly n=1 Tax=invertebrate metagenome TaxID=1711999 RepID=A0A484H8B0_9ZZZZ
MSVDKLSSTFPRITIDVRFETLQWLEKLRKAEELCCVAARTAVIEGGRHPLSLPGEGVELTVVLTDDSRIKTLNCIYRGQDKPTNVLSFPALEEPSFLGEALALGDILVALQTTLREAEQQAIPFADHFCHLVVHGALHLLGYDHQESDAAETMERLEARILAQLGIENPYADIGASTAP